MIKLVIKDENHLCYPYMVNDCPGPNDVIQLIEHETFLQVNYSA